MRDLQYMIDVMTAAKDGKKIQGRSANYPDNDKGWVDFCEPPVWAWNIHDYRIAPEPRKARECFVCWQPETGALLAATKSLQDVCAVTCKAEWIRMREVLLDDKP